jgi:hypothetical protein
MGILEFVIVLILLSWFGGFVFHVGGDLIHLLLLIAFVVIIYRVITGRKL